MPIRRFETVGGTADPPVGRHALDHEAGLTPIFTSMRRSPRRHAGTRALRPVVDPVEQFRRDPQTAPIPIVPALYAVDSPPPIDPYVPGSFVEPAPAPSPTEVTMCWSPGVESTGEWGGAGWTAHDPNGYEPNGYGPSGYDPRGYDPNGYAAEAYRPTGYADGYHDSGHDSAGYDYGYETGGYDPVGYAPDPYAYLRQDPAAYGYDPLTDSGRHHRRLAPAGW